MIRVVHPEFLIPDPDADFLPSRIPDPGVKKAPNPGSRIRIRNTGFGSGLKIQIADPDCESGSRQAKIVPPKKKKIRNFM
jgi:hypothetical protein